jgi:hypothetical protein
MNLYFPSLEELKLLGFEQAPEHSAGFDNYKKPIDAKRYYWITKRKEYECSISSIRIWLIGRSYSERKLLFSGHLISEKFFSDLLAGVGITEVKGRYFPSTEELQEMDFIKGGKCHAYDAECWRKKLNTIGMSIRLSINQKGLSIDQLRYDKGFWYNFEGHLPSKDFFECLIASFEHY